MPKLTIDLFEEAAKRFKLAESNLRASWHAGCNCPDPGKQKKCWNCPYYKGFGRLIQRSLHPEPNKIFAEITPPEHEDPYAESVKQQCCEMYKLGYSIQNIQQLVGVPKRRTLRNWLREAGLPARSAHYPEAVKQKCLKMYADGMKTEQIEDATEIPADTITDWVMNAGIARKYKYSIETKQQCLELYKGGHSSNDIHAMTGIDASTIRIWIAEADLGRGQKHYSEEEKQKCRILYKEGNAASKIESITGIKAVTIRSWIRKEQWNRQEESELQPEQEEQLFGVQRSVSERKPSGYWNDFDKLKSEIFLLNEARGKVGMMPTANELKQLARNDLAKAISRHHGGFQSVAEQIGLMYRKKRPQYWHDFENVKQALFSFMREHGTAGIMPTKTELEAAQMGSLCMAIELHGGFPEVARRLKFHLSYDRKPRGYWKNQDNLRVEIESVAHQLGNPGVLPTCEELKQVGRTDLISAIAKNGGWSSVARQLGFSYEKQYNNPNDYF